MAPIEFKSQAENQSRGRPVLLTLAILLGVAAFAVNWLYLRSLGTRFTVYRVTAEIPIGGTVQNHVEEVTLISRDAAKIRELFVEKRAEKHFFPLQVVERLSPGQLLTQRAFRAEGNTLLPLADGEGAVQLKINKNSAGILCFVGPGSVVDIWSMSGSDGLPEKILPRARILAIGDATGPMSSEPCNSNQARSISVAVPEMDVGGFYKRANQTDDGVHIAVVGSDAPKLAAQPTFGSNRQGG